jgi:hypothetical protein
MKSRFSSKDIIENPVHSKKDYGKRKNNKNGYNYEKVSRALEDSRPSNKELPYSESSPKEITINNDNKTDTQLKNINKIDLISQIETPKTTNEALISNKDTRKQPKLQNNSSKNMKKNGSPLLNILNSQYRGNNVTVLIKGIPKMISGEVVLNFDGILALKHENTTVYINSDVISIFY